MQCLLSQIARVCILAPSPTSCIIWSKLFNFSGPQLPHLKLGDGGSSCLVGSLGHLNAVLPVRCLEQGLAMFTGSVWSPASPAVPLPFLLKAGAQLPLCLLPTLGHHWPPFRVPGLDKPRASHMPLLLYDFSIPPGVFQLFL